jgi:hypothetical protein
MTAGHTHEIGEATLLAHLETRLIAEFDDEPPTEEIHHERHGSRAVRVVDRRTEPVDVYRLDRRATPGQRAGGLATGRRRR